MDSTHLHLILNHIPILGSLFGSALLLAGLIRSDLSLIKAALITIVISSLVAIPVFQTGESAEDAVEMLPGVSEDMIEAHEEAAEWAIWFIELLGAVSLLGLAAYVKKKKVAKAVSYIAVIMGFTVFGIMAYVGNLGGEIRHTEIRKDFQEGSNLIIEDQNEEAENNHK